MSTASGVQVNTNPGFESLDITNPMTEVEVEIRRDGTVLWVNIGGICRLRVCQISALILIDNREKPVPEATQVARLENWSVVYGDINPYQPPELQKQYLHGTIFNHPKFTDGVGNITTSHIVGIEGDKVRTKSGTLYELGEVDPEYEKIFPNARQRFLTSKRG